MSTIFFLKTMNPYCTNLNFNIPIFNTGVDLKKFTTAYQMQGSSKDLNHDLLKFLLKLGVKVLFFETFFMLPSNNSTVHVDQTAGDYVKINYVYYGDNSFMNWYKPKDGIVKLPKITAIGTEFLSYEENEVELLHSQEIGFPSLVQVGVPHSITNPKDNRLCISLVLHSMKNKRLTMDEALAIFKDYIV